MWKVHQPYRLCWNIGGSWETIGASLVAQTVKHLSAMLETRVRSLGWEDPLEKELTTHSSTLAWKIPSREEPGRLQSIGSQRVGHDWATLLYLRNYSSFYYHYSYLERCNHHLSVPLIEVFSEPDFVGWLNFSLKRFLRFKWYTKAGMRHKAVSAKASMEIAWETRRRQSFEWHFSLSHTYWGKAEWLY